MVNLTTEQLYPEERQCVNEMTEPDKEWEWPLNGYRIPIWSEEKVLELDSDDCPTL